MESVVLAIIAALAGIFLFKNKSDKDAAIKLAETKAKDKALKEQEAEARKAIAALDAGIAKMRAEQEAEARKRAFDNMSLKERADRIKKGLK